VGPAEAGHGPERPAVGVHGALDHDLDPVAEVGAAEEHVAGRHGQDDGGRCPPVLGIVGEHEQPGVADSHLSGLEPR
jgi:hypothetical protein